MSSHRDAQGNVWMVDVSEKAPTERIAVAEGRITVSPSVLKAVRESSAAKGDVLTVAQVAGIMGAKRAAEIIPLCHPLPLTHCQVLFTLEEDGLKVVCTARTTNRTGVEMEALTGVSVALLTVYDMCKSLDRGMEISSIRLLSKTGGKSGAYSRDDPPEAA